MDNYEKALNDLKELILTKFSELEKRDELRTENNRLRLEAIESKNAEQDLKINTLEKANSSTWEKIKNSFISWAVPFLCLAAIYYLASKGGGK